MKQFITIALLVVASYNLTAQRMDKQTIFQAMETELRRSMTELVVGDLPRPYHIEYLLQTRRSVTAHGVLGSLEDIDSGVRTTLTVRVRVGSPTFDNSNFFDVSLGFFGSSDDEEGFRNRIIPFEISESMLRRELWLATDACFKQAVEMYAKKQSALSNRTRIDTTADYYYMIADSREDLRHSSVNANAPAMQALVEQLSAIFRSYPMINSSRVGMEVVPRESFYFNSEGRRFHKAECFSGVEVIATTQATDGMPLAQTYAAYSITPTDLPSTDSLIRATQIVAETLESLRTAPTIEAYSGPVLFEGQAAGVVIGQYFAGNLVAQRPPLSESGFSTNERSQAFQNKIGARVLPEFLSVRARPTTTRDEGRVVAGSYIVDDEGIVAQDLTLVDKGFLRTLLSSRVPTKRIHASNGHQRGGGAMFGVIDLSTHEPKRRLSQQELKKKLLTLVKARALPYGVIVRLAMDQNLLFTGVYRQLGSDLPISQGEGKLGLLRAYRVFPDGKEELIRGVDAAGLAPVTFKDILAVSKNTTVHNFLAPSVIPSFISGGSSYLIATIITPDLLFEDIEVRPLDGDMPKPPALSNPIAEE